MQPIFGLLLVGAFCSVAYGLQCWECSVTDYVGKDNPCEDTFKPDGTLTKVTCNTTQTFCRKQKTGVNKVWNKITRGCADQCEERNTMFVDRVTCCSTDGCNNAGTIVAGVVLISSCFFLRYLF